MSYSKFETCNILVVGATGVGKSSLVNYLIGSPAAKVGVGSPVTGRDEIPHYSCEFAGVHFVLFDTWGIEVDKTEDWKRRIKKIIGEGSEDGVAWFHTVVYCIGAGGDRIQDHDLGMMQFFKDEGYSLIVAFTKCDQVPKYKSDIMEATLPTGYQFVEICSGGSTRAGRSKPFGKEELLRTLVKVASVNIHRRLGHFGRELVSEWKAKMLDELTYRDVGRFFNSEHENWVKDRAKRFAESLPRRLMYFLNSQLDIIKNLSNAKEISNASIPLDVRAPEGPSLSAMDVVGMIALSWAFIPFAVIYAFVNGEEDERKKLKEMIAGAAKQMNDFVDETVEKLRISMAV